VKSCYVIVASVVLLIPVLTALLLYAQNKTSLAYALSNYPVYKYILSDLAMPGTIMAVLAAGGVTLILSSFVVEARYIPYAVGIVFSIYTVNEFTLIIENEFFGCGCGLFYQTTDASTNAIIGLFLLTVNSCLLGLLRDEWPSGTLFSIAADMRRPDWLKFSR